MKIAIIGAGPAGMTATYVLSKNNIDVDVYESSSKIGGMCASIELWNQKVDLGPHRFFSNDKEVNKLWLEVVGEEYSMVKRQTRILYKFFEYPLELTGSLKNIGIIEATRCITSFLFSKN